jgi:hypothetical protein
MGVLEPLGAGTGVGAARVEDDRVDAPSATTCRLHVTGAATTRLLVNTGGGVVVRAVVDDEREVGLAARLEPAVTPAARKPVGSAVTGPLLRRGGRRSREAESEVGALDGASRGPLGEIVDGRDDDRPGDRFVKRELEVGDVGAEDIRRARPLPWGSRWTKGSPS